MKKHLLVYLTAFAMVAGGTAVMAQSTTTSETSSSTSNSSTDSSTAAANHKQDRQETMRILGLSRQDLKGLSKEERAAKMKEARKSKLTELEKKKTDGTITADEQKDLTFLQSHSGAHKKKASTDSQ